MSVGILNVYVWTSKVRPDESVGVTVIEVPLTVTFKKWKTWLSEVGAVAEPHALPASLVGDQPTAYASKVLQVPIGSSVPPPPPVT